MFADWKVQFELRKKFKLTTSHRNIESIWITSVCKTYLIVAPLIHRCSFYFFYLLNWVQNRNESLVFLYYIFINSSNIHTHGKTIRCSIFFVYIDTNQLNDVWLDKTSSALMVWWLFYRIYFGLPEIYMAYVQNCHQSEEKFKGKIKIRFNIANS